MANTVGIPPNAKKQFLNALGNPVANGTVFYYVPGTTTPKTTWSDYLGTVPNSNPVSLDAGGFASIYGTGSYREMVFDSLNNLVYDAVSEGAPTASGSGAVNNQTGTTYTYATSDNGLLVVRSNAAAMGDALAAPGGSNFPSGWNVNIKVPLTSAGSVTITPASGLINGVAGTLVINPGGFVHVWTDGTNFFSENVLPADNSGNYNGNLSVNGTLTVSGAIQAISAVNTNQGGDIASAGTINLDNATGNEIRLTGTVTVTAVTLGNGRSRCMVATAATPFTASASLIINKVPSGSTYTCVAGDILRFDAIGGAVYLTVEKFSPGIGSAPQLLSVLNASGATAPIVLPSGYKHYVLEISQLTPATNSVNLQMQLSTNGGSSYDSTANYSWCMGSQNTSGLHSAGSTSDTSFSLTDTSVPMVNTGNGWSGTVKMFSPSSATAKNKMNLDGSYDTTTPDFRRINGAFEYASSIAYNALQLKFSSGNISSGTIELWGIP